MSDETHGNFFQGIGNILLLVRERLIAVCISRATCSPVARKI